jgi:hypothetical protein
MHTCTSLDLKPLQRELRDAIFGREIGRHKKGYQEKQKWTRT